MKFIDSYAVKMGIEITVPQERIASEGSAMNNLGIALTCGNEVDRLFTTGFSVFQITVCDGSVHAVYVDNL